MFIYLTSQWQKSKPLVQAQIVIRKLPSKGWGWSQSTGVECWPSMSKALSLISRTVGGWGVKYGQWSISKEIEEQTNERVREGIQKEDKQLEMNKGMRKWERG